MSVRVCLLITLVFGFAWQIGNCQASLSRPSFNGSQTTRSGQELRPFTVAESIATVHFAEPDEYFGDHPLDSADGRRFLIVTERGVLASNTREYTILVFRYDKLDEPPVKAATFSSSSNRPGISQAKWLDDDNISLIGENSGEMPQVYVVNCKTKHIVRKTEAPLGVLAYDISRDQRKLIYYTAWEDNAGNKYKEDHGFAVTDESLSNLMTGNWRRPANVNQLYVKDLANDKTFRVGGPGASESDLLRVWISPDGQYAVTKQAVSIVPPNWASYEDKYIGRYAKALSGKVGKNSEWTGAPEQAMLVDTTNGEITPLINAPMADDSWMSVVWSQDSRSVIVGGTLLSLDTTDAEELAKRQRARPTVVDVDLPSKAVHPIIEAPKGQLWDVRPSSSADSFRIARLRYGAAVETLVPLLFRRKGNNWSEEEGVIENSARPEINITQKLDHWPLLVEIDRSTHRQTIILDPNPQLNQIKFGRQDVIHWTGKRGEPLLGGLFYPTDYSPSKRYPLVIQTHGFAPNMFAPDGPFYSAFAAQELANKGIVVLQIGNGPFYEDSKNTRDYGPLQLSQIDSAVDYLDGIKIIDPNRVGLVGFSITGFQVTYALTHSSHHFAVATSGEGNDWGYWSYVDDGNNNGWATETEALFGGPPWDGNWQSWMKDSITFNFDKIHTPLRLESYNNDYGSVINEWEKFIALKREHKPVELIYLVHGVHTLVKPWDRMTSQQGDVDWLLFWLKGEEDPDPSKAEQYVRWHVLQNQQYAEEQKLDHKQSMN